MIAAAVIVVAVIVIGAATGRVPVVLVAVRFIIGAALAFAVRRRLPTAVRSAALAEGGAALAAVGRRGAGGLGAARSRRRGRLAAVVCRALDRRPGTDRDRADNGDHRRLGQAGGAAGTGGDRPSGDRRRRRLAGAGVGERAHERQRDRQPDPAADRESATVDELAHRARAEAERGRDLLVSVALDRASHECLALRLRQRADGRDDATELLVRERDLVRLADAVEIVGQRPVRAGVTTSIKRAVADDRVQPGLQSDLLGRAAKRVP